MDKGIMVIKRDVLFSKKYFNGFIEPIYFDFETLILANYDWMEQQVAEDDYLYKQPIGYAIICNPLLKKVFIYQRSSKNKYYAEKRLQGKFSCGVGGHIEKFDINSKNPISASTLREITEEVIVPDIENIKVIGYINDDSDNVGKVHFGILFLVETSAEIISHKDPEIEKGELIYISEFEKICNDPNYAVENWTKIALLPLKKYFNDNQ